MRLTLSYAIVLHSDILTAFLDTALRALNCEIYNKYYTPTRGDIKFSDSLLDRPLCEEYSSRKRAKPHCQEGFLYHLSRCIRMEHVTS